MQIKIIFHLIQKNIYANKDDIETNLGKIDANKNNISSNLKK